MQEIILDIARYGLYSWIYPGCQMSNDYFQFKQFTVRHDRCAFKVGTDGVLLGAIADIRGRSRILDVGSGSGLIAMMLAQRSDAALVAIEPHGESYLQACENINDCLWAGRIRVVNCPLQDFYPSDAGFDLIVSNPPFFISSLRNPDPAKSLSRHNDTLTHQDLLEGSIRLLTGDGLLQVILPVAEGRKFIEMAPEYELYCCRITHVSPTPSSGPKRMVMAFSRHKTPVSESNLTIETGKRHEYTPEFVELIREFYLKF